MRLFIQWVQINGQEKILEQAEFPLQKAKEHSTISDQIETTTVDECFSLNSPAWLTGPRIGNIRDLPDAMASNLILDLASRLLTGSLEDLLGNTICHTNGRFRDYKTRHNDEQDIQFWALRFFYLGFHIHQHQSAIQEAKIRRHNYCASALAKNNIGNFDFECPTAKFIVVQLTKDAGLGAHMRLGALNALVAGVATNRTTLLLNHKVPWSHASCDRGDMQCFFLPLSPCVITEQELEEAYQLTNGETRKIFREGQIPISHMNDRVLIMTLALVPKPFPDDAFRTKLRQLAETTIKEIKYREKDSFILQLMQKSLDLMLQIEPSIPDRPYEYIGALSKPHHAAVFYAMRPNTYYTQQLKKRMELVIPKDLDPNHSFGLPIRASDKCIAESECLTFGTYMNIMKQVWVKHQNKFSKRNITILLTTESKIVIDEMAAFQSNKNDFPFDYSFIVNSKDVTPGSGLPTDYRNISKDDIMLSMLSSLQIQLNAGYSIGNCCSNFHLMLFDFLRDGCGAAINSWNQCLQENENPDFQVCCQWTSTDVCKAKRNQLKLQDY